MLEDLKNYHEMIANSCYSVVIDNVQIFICKTQKTREMSKFEPQVNLNFLQGYNRYTAYHHRNDSDRISNKST